MTWAGVPPLEPEWLGHQGWASRAEGARSRWQAACPHSGPRVPTAICRAPNLQKQVGEIKSLELTYTQSYISNRWSKSNYWIAQESWTHHNHLYVKMNPKRINTHLHITESWICTTETNISEINNIPAKNSKEITGGEKKEKWDMKKPFNLTTPWKAVLLGI